MAWLQGKISLILCLSCLLVEERAINLAQFRLRLQECRAGRLVWNILLSSGIEVALGPTHPCIGLS